MLLSILTALFSGSSKPGLSAQMSEGDLHSGPHGYSPNTAYPDTEYGDPDWEAEER